MISDKKEIETKFMKFLEENNCWNRATEEILIKFEKEFNKNRRTFQRWRKNLLLGISMFEDSNHKYRTYINRKKECYFCEEKNDLVVHHIDEDRNNNKEQNLLVLCPKCYHRLHQLNKRNKND